jgi:hypothetical protein
VNLKSLLLTKITYPTEVLGTMVDPCKTGKHSENTIAYKSLSIKDPAICRPTKRVATLRCGSAMGSTQWVLPLFESLCYNTKELIY